MNTWDDETNLCRVIAPYVAAAAIGSSGTELATEDESEDDPDETWQDVLAAPYLEDIHAGRINLQPTGDIPIKKSDQED